jgi:hypothetical protein
VHRNLDADGVPLPYPEDTPASRRGDSMVIHPSHFPKIPGIFSMLLKLVASTISSVRSLIPSPTLPQLMHRGNFLPYTLVVEAWLSQSLKHFKHHCIRGHLRA